MNLKILRDKVERRGPLVLVGVLLLQGRSASVDTAVISNPSVDHSTMVEPDLRQVEQARRDVDAALTLWKGPHVSLAVYQQVRALIVGAEPILANHPAPTYEKVMARSLGRVVEGTLSDLSASYQFQWMKAHQSGDTQGEKEAVVALLQLHPDPADPVHRKVSPGVQSQGRAKERSR